MWPTHVFSLMRNMCSQAAWHLIESVLKYINEADRILETPLNIYIYTMHFNSTTSGNRKNDHKVWTKMEQCNLHEGGISCRNVGLDCMNLINWQECIWAFCIIIFCFFQCCTIAIFVVVTAAYSHRDHLISFLIFTTVST